MNLPAAGCGVSKTARNEVNFGGFTLRDCRLMFHTLNKYKERQSLLARLIDKGVITRTGVRGEEITERGVIVSDRKGVRETIEAATIVIAAGSRPETTLLGLLKDKVGLLILAGDCLELRNIMSAMVEGYNAGLQV